MLTLNIIAETNEPGSYTAWGQRFSLKVGDKTYSRLTLVYEGQRRVYIREDGTLHVRRSQPRRATATRHTYIRALQYFFFSPKLGQFVYALSTGENRIFDGRLRRGRVYGIMPCGVGRAYTTELTRIRRRPWGVPTLSEGDIGSMRRRRGALDTRIAGMERDYQEQVKSHPRMSKLYSTMEVINA